MYQKNKLKLLVGISLGLVLTSGCTLKSKTEPKATLHVAIEAKVKGLDPIYANDYYSGLQIGQAYEGLLQYHYLKRPYELMPSLAESMPEVSADGLVYTFHIKKGVLFHDDPAFKETNGKGREMTADDFIYSFKRLADPKLSSNGWWTLDGKIAGLNAWRDTASRSGAADYTSHVEGLKALDRYTVQMKLVQKSSLFLYYLAMPFTAVVAHEAVDAYGAEFINHAVGTGPFRLEQYSPNSKIIWGRNPTYHEALYPSEGTQEDRDAGLLADAGKQLPLVDQVVVHVMVERQPMWLNFLSGKLDLVKIPKDNFASAVNEKKELDVELSSKGIRLTRSAGFDLTHVSFNMTDPLLGKNKYLRQAMSLAYDEATFIDLFLNGRGIPAQGPIPPGLESYDPKFKNPYRQFDLIKAKELLAKAGYPGGKGLPALEYASLADSTGRQVGEYFQKTMAALGVTIKVSAYSWPQLLETVKNRRAQIWEQAWLADYPDPETFLQLFYSKNASPGPNDSNYSNSEYDHLYVKSQTLSPGKAREAIYRKMASLVVEDCPFIFGAHRVTYTLTQPWLKNYKPLEFDHSQYKYYRVNAELKK